MFDKENVPELKIESDKEIISKVGTNLIRMDVVGISEMDVDDIKRHIAVYAKFGFNEDNKAGLLVVTKANVIMTKEARELSSVNTKKYFKKVAVVGHSLTVRFLINFLNRFYKFDVEMRLFSNEEEALKWLRI